MSTPKLTLVVALAALALAGCAKRFEADVARFHRIDPQMSGTVAIVPADEEKVGSLEFEQYAGLVRAALVDAGYRPVTSGNADFVVELDWAVSEGREQIRSYPGYGGFGYGHGLHGFGHRGFGHGFGHGRFGHGFGHGGYGFGGGYGGGVYSSTVHSIRMTVTMMRPGGEVVFEGRTESTIGRPDVPGVMPLMVQAMFADFPGESGRTAEVELELPKDAGRRY